MLRQIIYRREQVQNEEEEKEKETDQKILPTYYLQRQPRRCGMIQRYLEN